MTTTSNEVTAERSARAEPHPLTPLTADEIELAGRLIRQSGRIAAGARFITITLKEPPKQLVLSPPVGEPIEREAFVVLRVPAERATYEVVVSLTRAEITSWQHVPGAQPALSPGEFLKCKDAVRDDERWRAAIRRRGIEDESQTIVDAWTVGDLDHPGEPRRLAYALTFARPDPDDNPYARPVEGLRVLVDLDTMSVLECEDEDAVPIPPCSGNYTPDTVGDPANWTPVSALRSDQKPISITQPEGPSFTVDGFLVNWQKWQFRIGFTPREGLVLHQVGYHDRGQLRPIIYRASLSEIFTPYGDPALVHQKKQAFDAGEYGAGYVVNSLELGCDCLGEIYYFDVVANHDDGSPLHISQAICMHEEDHGIGWKHTDFRTGDTVTRRSRRLVVSTFATLGNYQYGYFWYFYLDGAIEFEVKLSGMISTGAVPTGRRPRHGSLVAPGLFGPNHQHFFNVRLDMSVDGEGNSVYEVNSEAEPPGPDNPHENAWIARRTLLATEQEAQRIMNAQSGRHWLVTNPNAYNRLGEPVAYKLQPGANVLPIQPEGSPAHRRAGFAYKHLWVTAYDEGQLFAAGDYPNQHPGGGLPVFTEGDRDLDDTDLVVWYTFGDHHVVRPEDWPVMPVTTVGFKLKPFGFFDGNPALDVPAPTPHCGAAGQG